MLYPKFLKKNDTIGICAPSAGVGHKLESFDGSLSVLQKAGYHIKETPSVRVDDLRSADAKTRAEELTSLFLDKDVRLVYSAAGGDFLFEILPYVNWKALQKNPKWLVGASDPTSLLFTYTTKYDVATIYGTNAGSYDMVPMHQTLKDTLAIFKGNIPSLHSFKKIASTPRFSDEPQVFDLPNKWVGSEKEIHVKGRCIGGCMDVLKDLIGTSYDSVKAFNKKYSKDGCVWYFDNFALSAETFYNTLLQMKYAHWFDTAKAIVFGRTLFPSSNIGLSYEEAIARALPDIPTITQADIGHTLPALTMINGALLELTYKNGSAKLDYHLKK